MKREERREHKDGQGIGDKSPLRRVDDDEINVCGQRGGERKQGRPDGPVAAVVWHKRSPHNEKRREKERREHRPAELAHHLDFMAVRGE